MYNPAGNALCCFQIMFPQTSIDRKSPGGCQGLGGGGMKSLCLMGLEFQFEEMKKFCRLRMVMFAQQYGCP